jgi:hypothetical protein
VMVRPPFVNSDSAAYCSGCGEMQRLRHRWRSTSAAPAAWRDDNALRSIVVYAGGSWARPHTAGQGRHVHCRPPCPTARHGTVQGP